MTNQPAPVDTPTARPENEALLPCPFCGGEAMGTVIHAGDLMIWGVECGQCGAERASDENSIEAHQFWNTRASTPTALPGAEDVALREAIAKAGFETWYKTLKWADERSQRDNWYAVADAVLPLIPRASDEVPANPVGEGLRLPSEQEFVSRMSEALALAYRRAGGVAHLARLKNGAAIIRNTAILEAAATYVALAGKSADAASSQEQGA